MTTISDKQEKSAHSVGHAEFPFVFKGVSHTRPRWEVLGRCGQQEKEESRVAEGESGETQV